MKVKKGLNVCPQLTNYIHDKWEIAVRIITALEYATKKVT